MSRSERATSDVQAVDPDRWADEFGDEPEPEADRPEICGHVSDDGTLVLMGDYTSPSTWIEAENPVEMEDWEPR